MFFNQPLHERRATATAGAIIALAAIVTVGAVAHHPSVSRAASTADLFAQIAHMRLSDEIVHGLVIAAALALFYGLAIFTLTARRRSVPLAALIAYGAGTIAALAAALIDGFLIPALAARYGAAKPSDARLGVEFLRLCAIAIQVVTRLYIAASSAAVLLWSIDLARDGGAARVLGALGVAAAVAVVGFAAFAGRLDPHTLGIIVVMQGIWFVALGVLMMRGLAK